MSHALLLFKSIVCIHKMTGEQTHSIQHKHPLKNPGEGSTEKDKEGVHHGLRENLKILIQGEIGKNTHKVCVSQCVCVCVCVNFAATNA